MIRRSIVSLFLVFAAGVAAAAQAPVSGTVEMQKEDGSRVPLADAQIDVYRTDIKAGFPGTKTNKKGEFAFAGLPFGATYAFAVSAPGASPVVHRNVRAGQENILIIVRPGDGSRLTEDVVRSNAAAPQNTSDQATELTAEQKKAQAEYDAKVKEVEAKNAKAAKTNEIVAAALKAGNEAFGAKNFDLAISEYDRGLSADPDFVGSAPVFLNNKGIALRNRAVNTYNATAKVTEATEKVQGMMKVREDVKDSAASFLRSYTLLKNAPPEEISDKANFEAAKGQAIRGAVETFAIGIRTEQVDPQVIDAAKVLVPEYLAIETDSARKAQANLMFADLYRVTADFNSALTAYKAVLERSPEDADALVGAGLSLFSLGYEHNSDKAMFQEGANFLQRFVAVAPDTHKFKKDAQDVLDLLKKEQNVTPQRQAAPARRRP